MSKTRAIKEEKQIELKELPIVAQHKGFVVKHSWLSPTEILFDNYKEAEVWNIETNSVTKVDKKPDSIKRYDEYADRENKLQISKNEFLIIATRGQYYLDENPDQLFDAQEASAIDRQYSAMGKFAFLRLKEYKDSWGIYKKNEDGKYDSIHEHKQPSRNRGPQHFEAAVLSENHIAILANDTQKIEFWKRDSKEQDFQHDRTLDLSHILKPIDEDTHYTSSLFAADPSTLIYALLAEKTSYDEEVGSTESKSQIILKIDCNSCEVVGKIEPEYTERMEYIFPDRLKKIAHPTKTLYYCAYGRQHDSWFYGVHALFDVDDMAFYKLPLESIEIDDDEYCAVSEKGLFAVNNRDWARFSKDKENSITVYKFPHDDLVAKNSEIAAQIELTLKEHLFTVLIGVIKEYSKDGDLTQYYGKPFWSTQPKSLDEVKTKKEKKSHTKTLDKVTVEEEQVSHKKCCIIM